MDRSQPTILKTIDKQGVIIRNYYLVRDSVSTCPHTHGGGSRTPFVCLDHNVRGAKENKISPGVTRNIRGKISQPLRGIGGAPENSLPKQRKLKTRDVTKAYFLEPLYFSSTSC